MGLSREYDGPAVDGSVQYIGEAPHWQGDGETVDVVDDTDAGEERTENVPTTTTRSPESAGQSTFDDWGWSA